MTRMLFVVLFMATLYSQDSLDVDSDSTISVFATDLVELINDRSKLHRLEEVNAKKDSAITEFIKGFAKIPQLKAYADSIQIQLEAQRVERQLETRAWEKLTNIFEDRIKKGNRLVVSAVMGAGDALAQHWITKEIDVLRTSLVTFVAWLVQVVGIWRPEII